MITFMLTGSKVFSKFTLMMFLLIYIVQCLYQRSRISSYGKSMQHVIAVVHQHTRTAPEYSLAFTDCPFSTPPHCSQETPFYSASQR